MRGLLPPFLGADATTAARSPYLTNSTELVRTFGFSAERREILRGFLSYRRLLTTLGYNAGFHLVDGSFVENVERVEKRAPGDIDVFSFLDLPTLGVTAGELDETGKTNWINEVTNRDENKRRFKLDSYAILLPELEFFQLFSVTNYWTSLFSHRRVTSAWKGFLAIAFDTADDEEALAELNRLDAPHA